MTGGQALARSLHREGVRVIFGLPGVQLYHLLDGLQEQSDIRFITTRHEQATTYMADGYARASGDIGTALVVPGPGLQNASAGIGTAYSASSPILVISGQVERHLIGVDRGALHEVNDQLDTIRPVTKWCRRMMNASDVPETVREAFRQLRTGRPRPVEIEIPPEALAEEADVELLDPAPAERGPASDDQLRQGAELLSNARRPIILAGGGCISSRATDALVQVAEVLQAPVLMTSEGKGAISERHPLCLGSLRLRDDPIVTGILGEADVILGVGTRMAAPGLVKEGQTVLQIEIDAEELGRNYTDTVPLLGDARATLRALHGRLADAGDERASRAEETQTLKVRRHESEFANREPLKSFLEAIRAAMPDDGILISGMTQVGYYSRTWFPVYEPATYLTSSYYGNLGYAYPTALGAKVACPDKAVVAVSGDGGFMYNVQEMATAVQYGINAVIVVFNDGAYGNVKRDQANQFDGRVYGSQLQNPDFMKLADAFGVRGERVTEAAQLQRALEEALAEDAPSLIEVPLGEMPYPY